MGLLLCPLVKVDTLEARTSNLAEPRVKRTGTTKSPSGSLRVRVSRAIPTFTSFFPDSCVLPTGDIALYKSLLQCLHCPKEWHPSTKDLASKLELQLQWVASMLYKTGSICMTYVLWPVYAMVIGPLLHFLCYEMGLPVWHTITRIQSQWVKIHKPSDSGAGWSPRDKKGKLLHREGVYFCENQALALTECKERNRLNLPLSGELVSLKECTMSEAQRWSLLVAS